MSSWFIPVIFYTVQKIFYMPNKASI